MKTIKLTNTLQSISEAVERVDEQLRAYKVKQEDRLRSTLTLEETLVKIADSMAETEVPIFIGIRRTIHRVQLRVTVAGPEINFATDTLLSDSETLLEEYGPETENLIRDLILRTNSERIRTRYAKGVNRVDILVSQNEKAMLYETTAALVLGVSAGLIARLLCSPSVAAGLNEYLFSPLYSLFLTAIAMIMVPMVFFSLVTSISGFGDLSALGRTGGKVFCMYLITTLIGILVAIATNALLMPGRPGMMTLPESVAGGESSMHLSLMDKLLAIVPDNFVGAFAGADMIQVMFLAVLIGVACTQIGQFSLPLKTAFESLSALFTHATSLISKFLPYAIFGAMAQMTLTMDVNGIGALASWMGVSLLCIVLQFLVYVLLLMFVGRLRPMPFIRKFVPAPLTAFFTSSSSATMPTTMACLEKMGVSRKVYSFSVPLGANINMDGTSLFFMVTTLFMAGLYGISVDVSTMLELIMSVMLISVALPGVPGAGTAALLMLFAIVGVPAEAFGIVIGLIPLIELFETALNVTGDGVVSAIVAKSEGEMDLEAYYK